MIDTWPSPHSPAIVLVSVGALEEHKALGVGRKESKVGEKRKGEGQHWLKISSNLVVFFSFPCYFYFIF